MISTESSVKRGGIRPEEVTDQHVRRSPEMEQLDAGVDSYHCDWDKE